jgi:hypothetical protein
LQLYFLPAPYPVSFSSLLKLFPPTYYPQVSPIDLLTYIFKLNEDSSPSTYSLINFKCVIFIPTHLFTSHLFIYLPTL